MDLLFTVTMNQETYYSIEACGKRDTRAQHIVGRHCDGLTRKFFTTKLFYALYSECIPISKFQTFPLAGSSRRIRGAKLEVPRA